MCTNVLRIWDINQFFSLSYPLAKYRYISNIEIGCDIKAHDKSKYSTVGFSQSPMTLSRDWINSRTKWILLVRGWNKGFTGPISGAVIHRINRPSRCYSYIQSTLREASPFQNGWIFGKVPNGLWPPPSFSENHVADFLQNPLPKYFPHNGHNLQHKFLDWKWPPPSELFRKFICFGMAKLP